MSESGLRGTLSSKAKTSTDTAVTAFKAALRARVVRFGENAMFFSPNSSEAGFFVRKQRADRQLLPPQLNAAGNMGVLNDVVTFYAAIVYAS